MGSDGSTGSGVDVGGGVEEAAGPGPGRGFMGLVALRALPGLSLAWAARLSTPRPRGIYRTSGPSMPSRSQQGN